MPSTRRQFVPSSERPETLQAALVGVAYVLAVQLAFLIMPFTSETLWLWPLGLLEAVDRGSLVQFLSEWEWWLALAFPVAVFVLGHLGTYAYLVDRNPIPALLGIGYLAALYLTEVVFMGRFEYAILYVLLGPIFALLSLTVVHVGSRQRTDGDTPS
jgi:hypothetical protein